MQNKTGAVKNMLTVTATQPTACCTELLITDPINRGTSGAAGDPVHVPIVIRGIRGFQEAAAAATALIKIQPSWLSATSRRTQGA